MLRIATPSTNTLLASKTRTFPSSHQVTQSPIVCRSLRQMISAGTALDRGNLVPDPAARAA